MKGVKDDTAKCAVIFRRGFYVFIGLVFVLIGFFTSFASPGAINMPVSTYTQREWGTIFFAFGAMVLIACYLTRKTSAKNK